MSTAVVFPGQGSQTVGMGKDIFASFPCARQVFEEVDDALHEKLSAVIFNGPEEELTLTRNAQVAIMTLSIAVLRTLTASGKFNLKNTVSFMAGHSLGEYTALCAAESITLADTAKLLRARGEAMQSAVPSGLGGMLSLVDTALTKEIAYNIAQEASTPSSFCEVSNDNSFGQIVLSGHLPALAKAAEIAKKHAIKMVVPLAVSAPFHCSLMQPAVAKMQTLIEKTVIKTPTIPVVMNVIARATVDVGEIKHLLLEQITHSVRWRESVLFMKEHGVDNIIEIGNGCVLNKLKKRIAPEINGQSIGNEASIQEFLAN